MREMNHSLWALLVSGCSLVQREEAVFAHPQSDMLPRLLTFFYLMSWHERCNLLLYEFWVTLRSVGRTCLSIAACSVMGQEAGLWLKQPLASACAAQNPAFASQPDTWGEPSGKITLNGCKERTVKTHHAMIWCDVKWSWMGYIYIYIFFSKLRGGEGRYGGRAEDVLAHEPEVNFSKNFPP